MTSSVPMRCALLLALALCLSGADCGGEPPGSVDRGSAFDCSNVSRDYLQASGNLEVTVGGAAVPGWRVAISPVAPARGGFDVHLSACVKEGSEETWRYAAAAILEGPVKKGAPVKLAVPTQNPPGFTGGVLDVKANREHHFLLQGAGEIVVEEFDPDARHFVAHGEVYPAQGGTVTLNWDLRW